MKRGLYWIASYPKSGNTWVRIFLSNLTLHQEQSLSLNTLNTHSIASDREWLDEALGFSTTDLSKQETLELRPHVYKWSHKEATRPLICKVHDANIELSPKVRLFCPEAMQKVVYLVRNPLDVAVSFANHLGISVSQAVDHVCNPAFTLTRPNGRSQVSQLMLTWASHVQSWVDQKELPIHVMRYEDMVVDPTYSFKSMLNHLEICYGQKDFTRALDNSSFSVLQQLELKDGFHERPSTSKAFFRSGRIGAWQDMLTDSDVDKIITANHIEMTRFGYLNSNGNPSFE